MAALEDEYPVPTAGEAGACGTEPVAVYDMSTGTLASSATCDHGAPDLVDVGEHCDQDQVFVEDDLAGTVFSITEGEGVYVPNIGNILPVQGDTTYTLRMVIKAGSDVWLEPHSECESRR